ncbi:MAG TPA: DUF5996 family protein [Acidobacteriaceae bacterium]|jgi:hypothetical protein|nr:DUF5996 family protein [Acidobacteriaceae bacterium]
MAKIVLSDDASCWPALPYDAWKDTCATLHMWTQIVGKVRLALTPLVNHWWNVPLYVTARGLTTSRIAYGARAFELTFDFLAHQLVLETSEGTVKTLALKPQTVADFYAQCMEMLRGEGIEVKIWRMPVEVPNPIAFDEDRVHAAYDPAMAGKFWQVLLSVDAAFYQFRSEFIGKVSPVHFFWGSFDLAVTRFSGRKAPERPGADSVTREAYSHEVSSVGFWPGTEGASDAAFYSYAAPTPEGFAASRVRPATARWDTKLGEYLLAYEDVHTAASPSRALLEFCRSTYEAAARFGQWDRGALERTA